jgi:citronellol/citronellal dehydrogenase
MNLDGDCLKDHLAFSIAKYAMSLCTLGMAAEFREARIAVNSLWPKSTIATQTIKDHFDSKVYASSRWPSIMADAAYELVLRPSKNCTGQFFTDEELLKTTGVTDFSHYAVERDVPLMQALFLPREKQLIPVSSELFLSNRSKPSI